MLRMLQLMLRSAPWPSQKRLRTLAVSSLNRAWLRSRVKPHARQAASR